MICEYVRLAPARNRRTIERLGMTNLVPRVVELDDEGVCFIGLSRGSLLIASRNRLSGTVAGRGFSYCSIKKWSGSGRRRRHIGKQTSCPDLNVSGGNIFAYDSVRSSKC